jgi:hypothetical protein
VSITDLSFSPGSRCVGSGSVCLVGGAQDRDALGRRRDWKGGLDPNGTSKRSSEFGPLKSWKPPPTSQGRTAGDHVPNEKKRNVYNAVSLRRWLRVYANNWPVDALDAESAISLEHGRCSLIHSATVGSSTIEFYR